MSQKIIDVHAHIYPDAIASKAVASIGNFYDIHTDYKDGTVDALTAICLAAGVDKVVVHGVATTAKQVESVNNFIADTADQNPLLIPFGTLHPDMTKEELSAEYARMKSRGIRGIKLHPDFQKFAADGKEAFKILSCLDGELPVMLHTGDKRYNFSNPKRIISLAKSFPAIKFIAAHFGGYSEWEYAEDYKEVSNVYFDTSSSLAFLDPERARQMIAFLGEDRFMFGSDFPMWSAADEKERIKKLGLSQETLEKIYYQNAAKFLNIQE